MTTQPQTVSDLYPSKWLKADDPAGRSVTLAITAVTVEQLHNLRTHKPEPKAILDFGRSNGCARHSRLPLNRTQSLAFSPLAGSDNVPARYAFAGWPAYASPFTLVLSAAEGRRPPPMADRQSR